MSAGKTRPDMAPWRSSRVSMRKAEEVEQTPSSGRGSASPRKQAGGAGAPRNAADDAADALAQMSLGASGSNSSDAAPSRSLQSSRWAPASKQPQAGSSVSTSASPARPSKVQTPRGDAVSSFPSKAARASMDASGLRPRDTSRPLGGKLDPMALLASPSRGLDATNPDGLLDGDITDLHIQLQFRNHISEQIRKHASKVAHTDAHENQDSISRLVLLARKLREGLLAGSNGKGKDVDAEATTSLLVEVCQLSVALSLLSDPPNVAQLQATLPRLQQTLSPARKLIQPADHKERLYGDLACLLAVPRSQLSHTVTLLGQSDHDGHAHIVSLQLLLALYAGAGRGASGQHQYGHSEYLGLRAELVDDAAIDDSDSSTSLRRHPHVDLVHRLHHALLHKDVASIRQLVMNAAADAQADPVQRRSDPASLSPTFWQLRLLLADDPSTCDASSLASAAPEAAAGAIAANIVGTTSNAISAHTVPILDRLRALVWDGVAKAYRPMGIPLPLALIPRDQSRLSAQASSRLPQASSDHLDSAPDVSDEASAWIERLLLLDGDFIAAVARMRAPSDGHAKGETAVASIKGPSSTASRRARLDAFLAQPARQLGADWAARLEVRADGTGAVLRLK